MARTVVLLGQNYSVPEPTDTGYDQALTNYLVALASAFPQVNGTGGALTAELDFGASFGLKSLYYKSRTANTAAAGQVRLASGDAISFRNAANGADVSLAKDSADALTWGGAYVTGNPYLDASTTAGQSINNAAVTVVVFGTVATDTDSAFNAGTGVYTVPTGKGGHYLVSASVAYALALTATDVELGIYVAGALKQHAFAVNPAADQTISVSALVNATAGQAIDVRTFQNAGVGKSLDTTAVRNRLTIKRIPT